MGFYFGTNESGKIRIIKQIEGVCFFQLHSIAGTNEKKDIIIAINIV